MPLTNPVTLDDAAFLQVTTHYQAADLREMARYSGGGQGVASDGDLAVTAQSTPDMSVELATGHAKVFGARDTLRQGAYLVHIYAAQRVVIPNSDPANPRIDRICIGIFDQDFDTSGTYATQVGVVEGTPAGSPVAPPLPTDGTYFELARVNVRAAAPSVLASDITDERIFKDGYSVGAPFTDFIRPVGKLAAAGPPASGTWRKGDYGIDSNGDVWVCTAAGTPGTWRAANDRLWPMGVPSSLVGSWPGTVPLRMQAGTVVPTVGSSGDATVPFPTPFSTGVVTVVATPGDTVGNLGQIVTHGVTVNSFIARCFTYAGAFIGSGNLVRINYIAWGW